eukprot:TRINITY_DN7872_c0_g1_i4.p1 TRINITY_DN7872_c0_g1~~TRINITY_DN7872_c0_g1_i4.p1  ORF type:complete len:594 (+),score=94.14 TRINITY_DN7872_c0_g1_i4:111-1892(+)
MCIRDRDNGHRGMADLDAIDLTVLVVYIALSLAVGLWAASKPQKNTDDYFLAGRSANPIAVAVSLISGLTSGISFLGSPGYAYEHGLGIMFQGMSAFLSVPLTVYLTIPFFQNMQCASAYAYLERRFTQRCRTVASCLFLTRVTVYLAIVLFAPALALNAVIGIPEIPTVLGAGTLATLYTMKGGMSSVIWTDFLQSITLVGGALLAMIVCVARSDGSVTSTQSIGIRDGFYSSIWLHDNSFWFFVIGGSIYSFAQSGADQIAIQRYMTTPDLKSAQKTALVGGLLNASMGVLLAFLGIGLFTFYHDPNTIDPYCLDPLRDEIPSPSCIKAVDSTDQILPYFFIKEFEGTGLPGAIVAAILGCTMSVFSSGLNAATTCTVVDLIQNHMGRLTPPDQSDTELTDEHNANMMRLSRKVTGCFGVATIGVAALSTVLGRGLVDLCIAALGLTGGPVLGLFMLGMLTTRTTDQGAECGIAAGLVAMVYFILGQVMCSKGQCSGVLGPANLNEFMYCPALMCITMGVGYGMSLFKPSCVAKKLANLTVWTRSTEVAAEDRMKLLESDEEDSGLEGAKYEFVGGEVSDMHEATSAHVRH